MAALREPGASQAVSFRDRVHRAGEELGQS
jgi:hypothetical protein